MNSIQFYAAYVEDLTPLIRFAIASKCSWQTYKEIIELMNIAPWTDKYLIQELKQKSEFVQPPHEPSLLHEYQFDYEQISDYDLTVINELRKGKLLKDAILIAREGSYSGGYLFDDNEYAEMQAYYDYLLEKVPAYKEKIKPYKKKSIKKKAAKKRQ